MIIAAVCNFENQQVRGLMEAAFGTLSNDSIEVSQVPPRVEPRIVIRNKELEQSHVCLGTSSYQQDHADR